MKILDVRITDHNGREAHHVGHGGLNGFRIKFVVEGADVGDRFRVEIFPDPRSPHVKEIRQIAFPGEYRGDGPQEFETTLGSIVASEYDIAIYRVDEATAARDINAGERCVWSTTIFA